MSQVTCPPGIGSLQKTTMHKSVISLLLSFTIVNPCPEKNDATWSSGIIRLPPRINLVPCDRKYLLWKLLINVSVLSLRRVFIFILKRALNRKVLEGWEISLIQIQMSAWRQCISLKFFVLLQQSQSWAANSDIDESLALANREFCKHFL